MQDNKFVAASLTVGAGDAVTWTFDGEAIHDITGSFASVTRKPGETFSFTFATPGTYNYRCDIHTIAGTAARMTGVVVVQ
ncbi:MAG: plastocyanin/azurin family copper-binding protein [Dehalococcoidia bacterium]